MYFYQCFNKTICLFTYLSYFENYLNLFLTSCNYLMHTVTYFQSVDTLCIIWSQLSFPLHFLLIDFELIFNIKKSFSFSLGHFWPQVPLKVYTGTGTHTHEFIRNILSLFLSIEKFLIFKLIKNPSSLLSLLTPNACS